MKRKSSMKKKLITSILVVILLVTMAAVTVFAEAETGVTLEGGSVSGGTFTVAEFPDVTLNGHEQETAAVGWSIMNITDGRGTGAGWTMTLTLTNLREYDTVAEAYVTDGSEKSLPEESITMASNMGVGEADFTSSPATNINVTAIEGTPLDTGDPINLMTAPTGEGMGSYNAFWSVVLTVPANAYATIYKADATTNMVITP